MPALGNGYYCDFSTSYIRFRVAVTLSNKLTQADGTAADAAHGYVRFERGPESMFRSELIQDASGNLLETNDLYCLAELLTNNKLNRSGPGVYHGEGLVLPGGVTPTVSVTLPSAGVYTNSAVCPTTVNYSPLAAGTQLNGKMQPLYFPCLGGAAIANYAMENSVDVTNPTESKFGADSLFDNNTLSGSNPDSYSSGKSGGRYYTIQLCSALFGGMADKYLPCQPLMV